MLFFLVVFGVGIIQSFFTPEKTRAFLSRKSELAGNVFAARLGIVTPFCSCSAVPLFVCFVTAGVPPAATRGWMWCWSDDHRGKPAARNIRARIKRSFSNENWPPFFLKTVGPGRFGGSSSLTNRLCVLRRWESQDRHCHNSCRSPGPGYHPPPHVCGEQHALVHPSWPYPLLWRPL